MVSGTLLQVDTRSIEDIHLYGNPKITYFKSSFNKGRNFALNYSKIPLGETSIDFGSTIKLKVPIKGDLLAGLYINFKLSDLLRKTDFIVFRGTDFAENNGLLPNYSSYVNGIGFNIIDEIKLFINGTFIQSFNSELIYMINNLHNNDSQQKIFNEMTYYFDINNDKQFQPGTDNISNIKCHLKIPFFFSRNPGYYLPLCSLSNSNIEIQIKLKNFEQCIVRNFNSTGDILEGVDGSSGGDTDDETAFPEIVPQFSVYNEDVEGSISEFEVIAQYVHLDSDDRKLFLTINKLEYLIELFHIGSQDLISDPTSEQSYYLDITCKHPTKYIMWLLQRSDVNESRIYDNYTSDFSMRYGDLGEYRFDKKRHILNNADILVNNTSIMDDIDPIFLSYMQLYEKFNGSYQLPMYIYNFSLNPLNTDPSGTINLTSFRNKQFKIELVNQSNYTNNNTKSNIQFRYYSSYYNILIIKDGLGGLLYQ